MNIKHIQILSDAENDLEEGRKFYDKQDENIGDYFWYSLLSDIESLSIFAGIQGFIECYPKGFPTQFIMMSMDMSLLLLRFCPCEEIPCG